MRTSQLRKKTLREKGLTLIEVMGMVAILALISANQFANTLLERQQTLASKSLQIMMSIGGKVEKLCEDTQRACTGLANGNITLPTDYMQAIPRDPGATSATNQYQITLNTASDGSKCFSIEGVAQYPNDAVLTIQKNDGTYPTLSLVAANVFLHYDSRSSTVYGDTSNTSPVAGGC
jgi:Tfp pilus assembly protein PilE